MSGDIGSLLGRWHQWRAAYSHERGYAQVRVPAWLDEEEEDWERRTMAALEDEIARLPQDLQLALQHVARSECLGVEVIMLNRLPHDKAARDALCARAVQTLQRRLVALGLM